MGKYKSIVTYGNFGQAIDDFAQEVNGQLKHQAKGFATLAVVGKRLSELRWVDAADATGDKAIAFDHGALLARAVAQLRQQVAVLQFPAGLLDEAFTLGELQGASEAVLGNALDKSSFRRRLDAAGVVEPVAGEVRTGPYRPAQVYRLAQMSAPF